MRLLDSEQLEYAFQMHGIDREGLARRFYADIWELIQKGERIRDERELAACERALRKLCNHYFRDMNAWRREEQEQNEFRACCEGSRSNMREAANILPGFERQFFRYALCYLELNRLLIQVRGRISHLARGCNIDKADILEVNHGTGTLLFRAHAQRMEIMEKRLRLERAEGLLRRFDPLMEALTGDLPALYGYDRGDHELTVFKGAVRKSRFEEARHIVHGWDGGALRAAGYRLIDLAQRNAAELQAQDGLMLHSGELSLILGFLKADEARVNQFLEKFNVPYMVFQYRNLIHLGYMLGRIGSLEGLIILHAKLLSLAARPHGDPVLAQAQESTVLVPARMQAQQRFPALGTIFNEMETTAAILEKLIGLTRDYNAHTPAP